MGLNCRRTHITIQTCSWRSTMHGSHLLNGGKQQHHHDNSKRPPLRFLPIWLKGSITIWVKGSLTQRSWQLLLVEAVCIFPRNCTAFRVEFFTLCLPEHTISPNIDLTIWLQTETIHQPIFQPIPRGDDGLGSSPLPNFLGDAVPLRPPRL